MSNYKKLWQESTKLAVYDIKYSQMIESQVYARDSKPRENVLF
ncbi:hypothetical protein M072_0684 [Bacteroides fragilis str. DS-208]|nr:hypothetical protein M072_0684 [Bacteroides fragilis str. DS-208]